jgi:microcystin-dependent protein
MDDESQTKTTSQQTDQNKNQTTLIRRGLFQFAGLSALVVLAEKLLLSPVQAATWQRVSGTAGASGMPAGSISAFAGSAAPTGWLLCFGQAVSRTTYADLFSAISTTYGSGDGSTTFNLPDLRGRVAVGKDNMGGTAANRMTSSGSGIDGTSLGSNGGSQTHTLTTAQLAAHTHGIPGSDQSMSGNPTAPYVSNLVYNSSSGQPTDSAGGGQAHQNTQPSIILNYIIKI